MGEQQRDGWRGALAGGRPAVHIGNVADFNAQFLAPGLDAGQAGRRRIQGHHYASMAVCYSPEPAVILLPHHVEDAWIELLAAELAWGRVELHSGLAAGADNGPGLADALRARPALLARIASAGHPVLPWGLTAGLLDLFGPAGAALPGAALPGAALPGAAVPGPVIGPAAPTGAAGALAATRRYESKAASHELFAAIAPDHPGIVVPRQEHPDGPRRAARRIAARAARGATTVLKSPHGVGGYGTTVVTPRQVAEAGGARALLRRLTAEEVLAPGGGLLLEEYIEGAGRLRDLTFDAVVGPDGAVHPVGAGVMAVDGTHYQGVTVGPRLLPEGPARAAEAFGLAVGRVLAAEGYRGWFDVDFVTDRALRLAPTEINLRLTGPAVAFVLKARLDEVRGPGHLVRTLDGLPLGARLSQQLLFDHVEGLRARCGRLGVTVLPLVPTASYQELPSVGLALAARDTDSLDAAESLVRAANQALGGLFDALVR
ncbi:hypothetical protein GCM10018781_37630 [Kitasatospora indigofera]|uniref:ATP-grasp domain-containing protein n=1 Tax=Kitasatospora indigofera TaxID=67307 RepID=A0A919KUX3_9ACTN|nr:hypothetical protein [Kitasatospora indigofera]GHH73407.1 hypothetical protein GCM10018781_37630 [Kitasatospora indigofera]